MKKSLIALALLVSSQFTFAVDTPDPKITPGDVLTTDLKVICQEGYTKTVRHVSRSTAKKVFASYGVPDGNHTGYCSGDRGCEVDHLISLELGGSNNIKNLWPQPYTGDWNATNKDTLENKLHALVCSGKLPIDTAQNEIASNWKAAYNKYVKTKSIK